MENSHEKTEQLHKEYIHDSKEEAYQDDYAGDISLPEQRRIIHRVDRRLVIITGFVRKILRSTIAILQLMHLDVLRLSHGPHESVSRCYCWVSIR